MLNILSQLSWNITIELGIHSLILEKKLLVYNALNVKKDYLHDFYIAKELDFICHLLETVTTAVLSQCYVFYYISQYEIFFGSQTFELPR